MVSINTSLSVLGAIKPEESVNDTDVSGLENIFSSMLSGINEEKGSLGERIQSEDSDGVMNILKEIKKNLDLNKDGLKFIEAGSKTSGTLSSNILQIYEAYKALIGEAVDLSGDAAITFDLKKGSEALLSSQRDLSPDSKIAEIENEATITNLDDVIEIISKNDLKKSIEELSELQMQKIKAALKQGDPTSLELEKNNKKIKPNGKESQSPISQPLSESFKPEELLGKGKVTTFGDQNIVETAKLNHHADSSKTEGLLDHTQTSTKSTASKTILSELNLRNNENTYETQLKLLEKSWGKDLAKIIEKAIISGKEQIDISLDPQKLGKMHLTLSVVNNQTSIFINTENAAASLILSGAEDRLAQMFEASGYKLSNFHANSGNNKNSDQNGPGGKQQKQGKDKVSISDNENLNNQTNISSYTVDGKKIINIIA